MFLCDPFLVSSLGVVRVAQASSELSEEIKEVTFKRNHMNVISRIKPLHFEIIFKYIKPYR